ncbi:MAG: SMC-Scp complex subunit ScpB [Candidatus Zixiibacteriota bacterium]
MMNNEYVRSTVEALILASPDPLPSRKIAQVLEDVNSSEVGKAISELNERYSERGSSFRIRELAGGYQMYILPEYVGYVEELFTRRRKMRLTRAALETVAIIAYRQPVTKAEIEHIRGVASDGVLHNLLEKGMVTIKGRANTVGKPLQYGTTSEFLKFFGLKDITDLPKMSEIEELISSSESQNQTELNLKAGNLALKLNVADGMYTPEDNDPDDDTDDRLLARYDDTDSDEFNEDDDDLSRDETVCESDRESADETQVIVDMGSTESSEK